jgi:hypothetical protein
MTDADLPYVMSITSDSVLRDQAIKAHPTDAIAQLFLRTGIRLEECYRMLAVAGLLSYEEYVGRGGPNYEMLTLALSRIPAETKTKWIKAIPP